MDNTGKLLTAKEAAQMLGISRCTLYRWLQHDWIAGITLPNGTIRIARITVEQLLAVNNSEQAVVV